MHPDAPPPLATRPLATLSVSMQLSRVLLEAPPPYCAELPVSVQFCRLLESVPPPLRPAELPVSTQLLSVAP